MDNMTPTLTTPAAETLLTDPASMRSDYMVIDTPQEILHGHDAFVIKHWHVEIRYIARFTGRTRRQWGMDCPTVDLYHIDTVVDAAGAIWGVQGNRFVEAGTFFVRPDYRRKGS